MNPDRWLIALVLLGAIANVARADAGGVVSQELELPLAPARIGATLVMPHAHDAIPCVLIVGGTLSSDRDGGTDHKDAPPRDALRRLADALAAGGYASLRFDQVGHGKSTPNAGWRGTYTEQSKIVAELISQMRESTLVSSVIVVGESAGAYVACLGARDGAKADAYVFLGALAGPAPEMYEFNFARLVKLADASPQWAEIAKKLPMEMALGRHYAEMFAAAQKGDASFELVDGTFHSKLDLARRKEELDFPPDKMFANITVPALSLSGEFDLNVPSDHASRAVVIMREAGNKNATAKTIAGADHSFQESAGTKDEGLRERYTFASFKRPYRPEMYDQLIAWLRENAPTPLPSLKLSAAATQPTTRSGEKIDAK